MKGIRFLLFILILMILPLTACSVQSFQVKDEVIQDDPIATYDAGYAFSVDGYFFFTDFSSVYRMKQGSRKAEKLFTTNGGVYEILYQSGYIYEGARYRFRTNGSGLEKIVPGGLKVDPPPYLYFATGGKVYYWCDGYIQMDAISGESKLVRDFEIKSARNSFGWKGKAYYTIADGLYQITDEGKSKNIFTGTVLPTGSLRIVGGKGVIFYKYQSRVFEYDTEKRVTTERPEFAAATALEYVGTRNGDRYYYYDDKNKTGLYVLNNTETEFIDLPSSMYDYVFNEESGRFYCWCSGYNGEYSSRLICHDVTNGQTVDILGKPISGMQSPKPVHFTQDFIYYIDYNEIHAIDTRNGNDTLLYRGEKSLLSQEAP